MPRTLNCCTAHKVWVPPAACKATTEIPATAQNPSPQALPNPLEAWRCHQWLVKSCLLACRAGKAAKAFPAGCHNPDPEASLQH